MINLEEIFPHGQVLDVARVACSIGADWANWSVTPRGIFFVTTNLDGKPTLMYFDFAAESGDKIADLKYSSYYLSVTNDGLLAIAESPELNFSLESNADSKVE